VLVRSWNLFHGNTMPPQRRAFLDEMLQLATADDPDVLCVQEVPAWALGRFAVADVAARPVLGPLPIPRALGRILTEPHHGLLRSAFSGQGNAIHVAQRIKVLAHRSEPLNSRSFRSEQAQALGLDALARLAWAKERRIVQVARLEVADGRTYLVANTHCTSYPPDQRIADAELLRAADFAVSAAEPGDVVVLAGDFNVTFMRSRTLHELTAHRGFSAAGPGIDHVLVQHGTVSPVHRWPDDRREFGGVLLSDHAPVEVEIE
jgi:endonuclease/exonuclease/phosphatase family metal-dependent hydrolase